MIELDFFTLLKYWNELSDYFRTQNEPETFVVYLLNYISSKDLDERSRRTLTEVCTALLHKIGRNDYWTIKELTPGDLRKFADEVTVVRGT